MRLIGHLSDETSARVFGDFLLVQGIENTVENDHGSGWAIWISEEDKIVGATELLEQFRANPKDERFRSEAKHATEVRAAKAQEQVRWEKKVRGRRQVFRPLITGGSGPLTLSLIVVCVVIYTLMQTEGGRKIVLEHLLISFSPNGDLAEIKHGQIWRLVTPILLHFGFLHILFNSMWLWQLGGMLEARHGTRYFSLLVLGLAVGSNLAEFYIGQNFVFGGMSGVVYGLLGYIWIRGRFDFHFGIYLHPLTIGFMLVWFVAGFAGAVPDIANWAHAGGLALGMVWGYISAAYRL